MSSQKHQYKDIGGQAVMEGVMMQSPSDESIAIAVRRPNGKIMVTCKHNEPLSKKHKWMGLPFIRGCVNMVMMLKMGMETLDKSTQMLGVMEEEPSKFEKWLAEKLGASIDKVVMAVAMVLAVALSLFLFVALPSGMATLVGRGTDSRFVINLSAGLTRIAILIGYMIAISFVPDIKRVFMYHGAGTIRPCIATKRGWNSRPKTRASSPACIRAAARRSCFSSCLSRFSSARWRIRFSLRCSALKS